MTRIQTVAPKGNFFGQRVTLSKAWHGLRHQELESLDETMKDMEFVHHSGFIGGAWTLATAIKMAEISLVEHRAEVEKEANAKKQDEEIKQE